MTIAEKSSLEKNVEQSIYIRKILTLRGPNIWSRTKVLECWIEFPAFISISQNWKSNLFELVPVIELQLRDIGSIPDRQALANLLLSITIYLQNQINPKVNFGKVVPNAKPEIFRLIFEYDQEQIAQSALEISRQLLEASLLDQKFDLKQSIEQLLIIAHSVSFGPSTQSVVDEAEKRRIPVTRLTSGSLVQLGWGSRQKKILASSTCQTSSLAQDIVQDKELTRCLLHEVGMSVPKGRTVKSPEDAWIAAMEIGLPVVVKPCDGSQGRGVAVNLTTQDQVTYAFNAASKESSSVILEQYIYGETYRILIVGGKYVAATHCIPAHVIGDGILTIRELVDEVNKDPRRSPNHATALSKMYIDEIALGVLKEQNVTISSIPAKGKMIFIRRNGNLSTGGTGRDVTDLVHPTIQDIAAEAARIVGLDICGIDMIIKDLSQPLSESNGVFVELNARPGLRMHLHPCEGKPRPVGAAIIDTLFAPGENGRIPIVAITGVNGKTTTTRFIAHLLSQKEWTVGMCNSDGTFAGERLLSKGDCSGPKSAHNVLEDPFVDVAVLETARGGILREGLAFDYCDVAVVTNIGSGDHLGIDEIHTPEQLAIVKRCIVEAVPEHGTIVINAMDPLVVKMAESRLCHIIYFAHSGDNEVIRHHRQLGGRAIFVRDGLVIIAEGDQESILLPIAEVSLTQGGRFGFQIENTLASIGAAWALDLEKDLLCQGARSFTSSSDHNVGRFNLFDIAGIIVVIDFGHNIDALRALLGILCHFDHSRRLVVYSAAGDRRDCDMIEQGRMLGAEFDEIWLYEGNYLRGRKPGEIMALIASGVEGGMRAKRIECIQGHLQAIDLALLSACPGDFVMIQADISDETVQHLKRKHAVKYIAHSH